MSFEIVSQNIELSNASLNILRAGEGEAVVLIPSWARGADDFTNLMQVLAGSGYRAIAINPRGVGSSTGYLTDITLHDLAADVAGIIKALNMASVNVLGHAYGNKTARCLAADYPELVKRVILLAAGGEVPPDPVAFAALKSAVTGNLSDAEWLSAMEKSHFFGAGDPNIWRSGWYPDVAIAQLSISKATPNKNWWRAGTAPMLIVQGLDDLLAPPANGRILQDKLENRVKLVELKNTAHALLPEQPEIIAQTILDFIGR